MDRRVTSGRKAARSVAGAGLALVLTLAALAADAGPYRRGGYVTVRGTVAAADGAPLAHVTVLLEASRRSFKLSRIFNKKSAREKTDTLTVPVTADASGRFSLDWRWDPYYDTFELAVALPTERGGRDAFEVFQRLDLSEKIRQGSPVDVTLTIDDRAESSWLKRFLDRRASADEQRIFREMGRPDKVETQERASGAETSWWYFADGKVYRFVGGSLSQVTHFEPIPPAPEES